MCSVYLFALKQAASKVFSRFLLPLDLLKPGAKNPVGYTLKVRRSVVHFYVAAVSKYVVPDPVCRCLFELAVS